MFIILLRKIELLSNHLLKHYFMGNKKLTTISGGPIKPYVNYKEPAMPLKVQWLIGTTEMAGGKGDHFISIKH